jgi:iron complex transport system ATP-binding protein
LLVQAPQVYLLDEPTNHLDPAQQISVLQKLRELARDGALVVASLHDPNLALRFADRVALLSGSGGLQLLDTSALETGHLDSTYGLRYAETRLGGYRFMAPD